MVTIMRLCIEESQLSLPALIGRCRTTLAGFVADEGCHGNLASIREEELLYVLHKLLELRLWPGSLWATLSSTPSKYATDRPRGHPILSISSQGWSDFPAVDTSLPASGSHRVTRSSCAHVFHFYALLCEIQFVPRKAPSVLVMTERLAPGGNSKDKDEGPIAVRIYHPLGHVAMSRVVLYRYLDSATVGCSQKKRDVDTLTTGICHLFP